MHPFTLTLANSKTEKVEMNVYNVLLEFLCCHAEEQNILLCKNTKILASFNSGVLARLPTLIRFMFHSKITRYGRNACGTSLCYLCKWVYLDILISLALLPLYKGIARVPLPEWEQFCAHLQLWL